MRLRRLLEENRDIILRIEFLQETRRGNLYILKAKVVLIDSSVFYTTCQFLYNLLLLGRFLNHDHCQRYRKIDK